MSRTILKVEVIDVEKRRHPGKHYVYKINVHWSDQSSIVIYRRYSRFFDLQSKLLEMFPLEAGVIQPSERIIPLLPGKILFGRSHIREVALKRLKPIDDYCKGLIKVPASISQCDEVLDFFTLELEDLDPPKQEDDTFFRRSRKLKKSKAEKISKPRTLKQYTVIADYNKQETGEIQLQQGMLVEVVEKSETGWWFVNSEDEQGWVPSTYLEPVDGGQESSTQRANPGEEEKYVCIETFTSENSDEMSLEKGVVVEVIEKNLEGWWLVRYDGQEGLAPATYLQQKRNLFNASLAEKGRASGVEIIGTLSDISDLLNKELKADHDENRDRLSYAIGPEGDTYTKVNLKSKSLERGGSIRPPPRQNSIAVSKELSPPPTPRSKPCTYMTVADFTDPVGDGINFTAGQPVTVIEKGANDWWFVQIDGKEGWAPMSYIKSGTSQQDSEQVLQPAADEVDEFDSSDSDSDQPSATTASGIAAALQNKFNKKTPESVSKPGNKPPPPPQQSKKPVLTPPSVPKPAANKSSSKWSPPDGGSVGSSQRSTEEDAVDGEHRTSGSRVSGLASSLKSKFESSQAHSISHTDSPDSSHKPGKLPGRAVMPKNNTSNVKPLFPGKPVAGIQDKAEKPTVAFNKPVPPAKNTSEKPVLAFNKPVPPGKNISEKPVFNKPVPPVKNSTEKPVLAFNKPGLPGRPKSGLSSSCKTEGKRPTIAPPTLPPNPPRNKPATQDSNNNSDVPKLSANVSGIAAALKSKFEQTESNKAKPSLPPVPHGSAKPGKINSNWNTNSVSSKTASHAAEQLNSIKGSKPVGHLVSALSGKLNFGADQQTKRLSVQSGKPVLGERHDGKPVLGERHDGKPVLGERHDGKPVLGSTSDTQLSNGKSQRYTAIAEYTAQADGELFMQEGEQFVALETGDSGWWQVSNMEGQEGWVPASYLTADHSSVNADKGIRPGGPSSSNRPPSSIKPSSDRPTENSPLTNTHSTTRLQYTTTALFTAENDGEIGFDEGEDVEVVEKSDGWWFVRIGQSEGWAPADYIKETSVQVTAPAAGRPQPPKNKPVFKPTLPARPR